MDELPQYLEARLSYTAPQQEKLMQDGRGNDILKTGFTEAAGYAASPAPPPKNHRRHRHRRHRHSHKDKDSERIPLVPGLALTYARLKYIDVIWG